MATDVGERYARALLEVTEERKETDKAAQALQALVGALSTSAALEQVLHDPRLRGDRMQVFEALADKAQAPKAVHTLLKTLDAAERLSELGQVATAFLRLADEKAGRVRGEARSAVELADAEKQALSRSLGDVVGKKVALEFAVDASLLGGVVVKVQDLVWDGSVRTQLERMRHSLREGR